jgi:hypothetical protein
MKKIKKYIDKLKKICYNFIIKLKNIFFFGGLNYEAWFIING